MPERAELGNCWDWMAARNEQGYGSIAAFGRMRPAHRIGYEMMVGLIPEGLVLDHLCRRTCCVRYTHAEPVTQAENIARGELPGALRLVHARLRALTHCKHGHEFAPENTRVRANGTRVCKACQVVVARRCRKRKAARLSAAA